MDWLEKDLQEVRDNLATVDTSLSEVLTLLTFDNALRSVARRTQASDMRVGLESALESLQRKEARDAYYREL